MIALDATGRQAGHGDAFGNLVGAEGLELFDQGVLDRTETDGKTGAHAQAA